MSMPAPAVTLHLSFAATPLTPATELVYRTDGLGRVVVDARLRIDGQESPTTASNDIFELTYRYREKAVSRAVLRIGDAEYVDDVGDGVVSAGPTDPRPVPAWEVLAAAVPEAGRVANRQPLFPLVPALSGADALRTAFRAECGSLAAVVHELRGHSLLWAAVPPGSPPNEVHRHVGGIVYCVFYRGTGRFHRVTPGGFETVPIGVTDANPFQMVALADHLWYQPINTGPDPLHYFMVHAPAFEQSEMLALLREECRPEWGFEW